jgi:uncharacterized protein
MNDIILSKMEIKTKKASYCLIPQLGILVNSELVNEFLHLIPDKLDEKKIVEILKKELSDDEIEERVASIFNITFNVLEDCNYRCSYCIYSGNYEGVRTHNPSKMSFKTAKKMINHLISWITNKKRNIKTRTINIGFYGGEPLMEFPLIKEIIEYSQFMFREKKIDEKFDLGFRLNTNGYLLKNSIVDLLVQKDITLDVSLDGPKEEHDKYRLHRSGKKTWDIIWNNLMKIREKYPNYYADKINFLCTMHPLHDYKKIDQFFINNPDYFNLERVSTYYVNMIFLKKSIKNKLLENRNSEESYINLIKSSKRLDNKLRLKNLGYDTIFTAMCFPGEAKLFVATDGKLHICERIKNNLPIGDTDNGIDFDAVRKIYRLWNDEIIRNRCWECIAWSFCGVCVAHSEDRSGGVRIDCNYKDKAKNILTDYLSFLEENGNKEKKLINIETDSIDDYLKKL